MASKEGSSPSAILSIEGCWEKAAMAGKNEKIPNKQIFISDLYLSDSKNARPSHDRDRSDIQRICGSAARIASTGNFPPFPPNFRPMLERYSRDNEKRLRIYPI